MPEDNLIAIRGRVKAKLTRIANFIKALSEQDGISHQYTERKPLAIAAFAEFNDIQNRIEGHEPPLATEDDHANERDTVETLYCNIMAEIEAKVESIAISTTSLQSSAGTNTPVHQQTAFAPRVNLPKLDLKGFSGSHSEWLTFVNSFRSIIHDENNRLDDCQRFQYLLSCLSGEALKAVDSLSISAENYRTAWDILEKRFKNERLIARDHVTAITEWPMIGKASDTAMHTALREFLDAINSNLESLKKLGVPVASWDAILVPIVENKLDYATMREWQTKLDTEIPKFQTLVDFLEMRVTLLKSLSAIHGKQQSNKQPDKPKSKFIRAATHTITKAANNNNNITCNFCSKPRHLVYQCVDVLKLSIAERNAQVATLKLCANCLRTNHAVADCRMENKCRHCDGKHNTLLHEETSSPAVNRTLMSNVSSVVLLSTAIVLVKDFRNLWHECRALLDVDSTANYITAEFSERLNLKTRPVNINITGIGQIEARVNKSVDISLKSMHNNFATNLNCLVLETITEPLPSPSIKRSTLEIPSNIKLADPKFFESAPIDLLIGAELFWQLLCVGQVLVGKGPQFQKTHLGWIAGGAINAHPVNNGHSTILASHASLNDQVQKFWQLEQCDGGGDEHVYSPEERECEEYFRATTRRNPDGRFVIKFPFVNGHPNLGQSYDVAIKRFRNIENNLKRHPSRKEEYQNFMSEYRALGHMEEVPNPEQQQSSANYLPHHSVLKESSTTTKLRVVFDASVETSNGLSLNDNLLAGPVIQQDLFSILTRFRTHKYVLNGDIAKMYRQIAMHPEHADFQRIVWRDDPSDTIRIYRLKTLTYGTKPASFIATRCLKELAELNKENFPIASKIISRDFYMDDLLTGSDSTEELIALRDQIVGILNQGKFELRKFASNDVSVLPKSNGDIHGNVRLDKNEFTKTLGLFWNPHSDCLKYEVKPAAIPNKVTKRNILSMTAQIFDPLGLLGPVIIKAKMLIQQLWSLKLGWDESVPYHIHTTWTDLLKQLYHLNELQIPRCVMPVTPSRVELHGFCDASVGRFGMFSKFINNAPSCV